MQNVQDKWLLEGIEPLLDQGEREEIPARETVYYPGTQSTSVYFVEKGKVKLSYLDPSGKRITLALRAAGELFGEMALVGEQRHRHHAEAMEDSVLIRIPREKMLAWVRDRPDVLYQLLQLFGLWIRDLEEIVEDLAFRDIQARLSRQLLRLSHEYGVKTKDGILISFRLTHRDLAEMIGSARENTTMALNRFAREGILKKRRYQIIIKDVDGLKEKCGPS
ncbi:MAG TPA: Crp/Fnr family transcriptional regulator [Candidatus Acetothermia bacterium]|nr:Crp/Fnr family transcriptional regulator [Candidatus Acetothermia bacterium]